MFKRNWLFVFLLYLIFTRSDLYAQIDSEPLILENVNVHRIQSTIVDQVYELHVALPASYHSSPDKAYPLIVVLDGQWSLPTVSHIAENLAFDGMIPEAVTVGITWADAGENITPYRLRDFVRPEIFFLPDTGGASQFLASLTEELVPYVESLYRTGDKRVLLGGSLSGLFTSYAMLEKPRYFDGYVSGGGSYSMDLSYFEEKLELMCGSADLKKVRSFLTVGSLDSEQVYGTQPFVEAFNEAIESANLRGFKHKYKVFRGLGHSGLEAVAYTYGLQYVFKRPFLKLSEEFLQQYAGVYEGGLEGYPPFPVTVSVSGRGKITIEGEDRQEYLAETETRFYIRGIKATAEFPEEGQLVIYSGDTPLYFTRISQ